MMDLHETRWREAYTAIIEDVISVTHAVQVARQALGTQTRLPQIDEVLNATSLEPATALLNTHSTAPHRLQ